MEAQLPRFRGGPTLHFLPIKFWHGIGETKPPCQGRKATLSKAPNPPLHLGGPSDYIAGIPQSSPMTNGFASERRAKRKGDLP